MKGHERFLGTLALGFALTIPVALAEGTGWVLNLDKSALVGNTHELGAALGPVPTKAGLMLASVGVAPRGHEGALKLKGDELSFDSGMRFTAKLDGRDYPIAGLPVGDTIAIELAEDDQVVSTIKSAGTKIASFKRSLSDDERTMVVTARYFGDDGRVARERLVFERR